MFKQKIFSIKLKKKYHSLVAPIWLSPLTTIIFTFSPDVEQFPEFLGY